MVFYVKYNRSGEIIMLLKKNSIISFLTYLIIFIVFTGMFASEESDATVYPWMLLYFFICSFAILFRRKLRLSKFSFITCIIMVVIWMYGMILGLISGNPLNAVFRNFFGMTMYILVIPISNSNVEVEDICHFILGISNLVLFMSIFSYCILTFTGATFVFNVPILNAFVGGGGTGGFVQYFGREIIHVTFAYNLVYLLFDRFNLKSFFIIIMCLINGVFINDSGGDLLAFGVISLVVLLVNYRKMSQKGMFMILSSVLFSFISFLYLGEGLLARLFSNQEGGNIRRLEEIEYMLRNTTFVGHGLGAPLGYAGATSYNYGTEVIYLNIFHKFGVFAILILMIYVFTCIKAIKVYRINRDANGIIPIALMAYLIPSLANPMLFGSVSVMSHVMSVYIIEGMRVKKAENKYENIANRN